MIETTDEKQIVGYLLGTLSDAEQIEVEIRFLRDAEFLETSRALEDDLIDDYINNELSESERQLFEKVCFASPPRQEKVAFARKLAGLFPDAPAAINPSIASHSDLSWARLKQFLLPQLPAFRFAIPLLLLAVAIVAVWLYVGRRNTQTELARIQQQQRELEQRADVWRKQSVDERSRNEELQKEIAREREERQRDLEALERLKREQQPGRESETQGSAIASFVLGPGFTRGSDEPIRFVVPKALQTVQLQLDLQTGETHKSYRAELRTTGGNVVWSRDLLRAQTIGGGKAVVLQLPGTLLGSGEYELTLRAPIGNSNFEDIGYYYFSVLRR